MPTMPPAMSVPMSQKRGRHEVLRSGIFKSSAEIIFHEFAVIIAIIHCFHGK
jgi:hypothetical protein